nr:hypothetical protein CFP56_30946 [Quercus suber]
MCPRKSRSRDKEPEGRSGGGAVFRVQFVECGVIRMKMQTGLAPIGAYCWVINACTVYTMRSTLAGFTVTSPPTLNTSTCQSCAAGTNRSYVLNSIEWVVVAAPEQIDLYAGPTWRRIITPLGPGPSNADVGLLIPPIRRRSDWVIAMSIYFQL